MSAELLEPEPDGPDYLGEKIYQAAYIDYVEGLMCRDSEKLHSASHVIDDAHFPLARTIRGDIRRWEEALYSGENKRLQKAIEDAFGDGVRSYVYSGTAIDPNLVLFANEMLGFDKKWLRHTVQPGETTTLAWLRRDGMTSAQRSDAIYYGKSALLTLGLGSFSLRLSARFGLLR